MVTFACCGFAGQKYWKMIAYFKGMIPFNMQTVTVLALLKAFISELRNLETVWFKQLRHGDWGE